ncbi:MAG TPA: OmpH family outer membrane protein [Spirochaetia bacterium]|nr:OmpH family outer membrane protein [Spirochaetia bacterium]HRZ64356.1 OmpH family outer membrane protein [Spirochaetia bacterium]
MNAKRILISLAAAAALAASAFGQQITRVAVMDFNRILASRSGDASSLRDFELKKSLIQAEIDKRKDEIMRLLAQKVEADKAGDAKSSAQLRSDIESRTKQLSEFAQVKQRELDAEAKTLVSRDAFAQNLYRQVQAIAESEGYSLVLNVRSADSVMEAVFWYSQMIDITDKVIQALAPKSP